MEKMTVVRSPHFRPAVSTVMMNSAMTRTRTHQQPRKRRKLHRRSRAHPQLTAATVKKTRLPPRRPRLNRPPRNDTAPPLHPRRARTVSLTSTNYSTAVVGTRQPKEANHRRTYTMAVHTNQSLLDTMVHPVAARR